jgi:hypothetical protein
MNTDELIASLATDLRPVRRVRPPVVAALAWVAAAAVAVGLAVLWVGPREDLAQRFANGADLTPMLAAVATGVLAALAAFECALPDRSGRWALLPLPGVAAWVAALGWGCVQEVMASGAQALYLGTSFQCIAFISGLGVPLALGMMWLSRHAAALRAGPVSALGGLAAAALASAGLSCVHYLNAAAMILVWHGLAVVLVTVAASVAGPRIMRARLAPL